MSKITTFLAINAANPFQCYTYFGAAPLMIEASF
jgi:hypothetical protein